MPILSNNDEEVGSIQTASYIRSHFLAKFSVIAYVDVAVVVLSQLLYQNISEKLNALRRAALLFAAFLVL